MLVTPQFIQTDKQLTAVIHLTVPRAKISHVMGPAITEIMSTIAAQGATITGPCFSYHQKRPTGIFDFEVDMKGLVQPGVSFANGLKPKGLMCKKAYGNAI